MKDRSSRPPSLAATPDAPPSLPLQMRSQASRILTEPCTSAPPSFGKPPPSTPNPFWGAQRPPPHHEPTAAERAARRGGWAPPTRALCSGCTSEGPTRFGTSAVGSSSRRSTLKPSSPLCPSQRCPVSPAASRPTPRSATTAGTLRSLQSGERCTPRRPDLCRDRLAVLCRRAHRDARLRGCGHVRRYSFGEKCLRRLIAHRQLQKGRGRAGGGADPELRKLPRETGTHRDAARTAHAASSSLPAPPPTTIRRRPCPSLRSIPAARASTRTPSSCSTSSGGHIPMPRSAPASAAPATPPAAPSAAPAVSAALRARGGERGRRAARDDGVSGSGLTKNVWVCNAGRARARPGQLRAGGCVLGRPRALFTSTES